MKAEEVRQIADARIAADARRWREGMLMAVALAVAFLVAALLVDAAGLFVGLAAGWLVGMLMGAFGATARRAALEDGARGFTSEPTVEVSDLPPAPPAPVDMRPWHDIRPEAFRGGQYTAMLDRENHVIMTPAQWRERQKEGATAGDD